MVKNIGAASEYRADINSVSNLTEDRREQVASILYQNDIRNISNEERPVLKIGWVFNNIFLKVLVLPILLVLISGCGGDDNNDDTELLGNWFELSDFEGVPRSDAVVFSIGYKAYVGTGYDGSDRLKDFWEYDPQQNNWTRKADFPGVPRNGAIGFGTDAKGYIGTGYDNVNRLKDFWEYDPATNTWKKISDFGGTARYGAVAFSIDNKGYVGTGDDGNFLKDFWQYDPSTDQWTQKLSLGGTKRRDAVAFVIGGKGFIVTGINNGTYVNDFWEYNPTTEQWAKKRSISNESDDDYDDGYTNLVGINRVGFSFNGKGYIATGGQGTVGTEVYEYDPATDIWAQKTSLEASSRIEAVGFSIGDKGYLTTGRNGSYYFDDLWGFEPSVEQQDLDKVLAPW